MSGQKARVEVEICGDKFTIKGDESPEHIEMVANYVDRKVKQLVNINPKLTTTNAAILAAINIADELSKLQADYDNLLEMMDTLDADAEKK
ncbi:cell division protein ZapA [Peptococcaceae bacterium 1198_IL3148]